MPSARMIRASRGTASSCCGEPSGSSAWARAPIAGSGCMRCASSTTSKLCERGSPTGTTDFTGACDSAPSICTSTSLPALMARTCRSGMNRWISRPPLPPRRAITSPMAAYSPARLTRSTTTPAKGARNSMRDSFSSSSCCVARAISRSLRARSRVFSCTSSWSRVMASPAADRRSNSRCACFRAICARTTRAASSARCSDSCAVSSRATTCPCLTAVPTSATQARLPSTEAAMSTVLWLCTCPDTDTVGARRRSSAEATRTAAAGFCATARAVVPVMPKKMSARTRPPVSAAHDPNRVTGRSSLTPPSASTDGPPLSHGGERDGGRRQSRRNISGNFMPEPREARWTVGFRQGAAGSASGTR